MWESIFQRRRPERRAGGVESGATLAVEVKAAALFLFSYAWEMLAGRG
ncbi:MAG: hypothetical protein OXL41_00995 [Nitrospinae bacterium]|nr:hypothetical protein [Nitrospinota bacterium]